MMTGLLAWQERGRDTLNSALSSSYTVCMHMLHVPRRCFTCTCVDWMGVALTDRGWLYDTTEAYHSVGVMSLAFCLVQITYLEVASVALYRCTLLL